MNYTIKNNWLYDDCGPIEKIECSEKKYSDGNNICDYIVFHYTASGSSKSAHNTYKAKGTQVSWHLTIDTDGSIYQLLDFRKRAWHAGRSNWIRPDGTPTGGLNKWAIGIEIINPGPLSYVDGNWYTWYATKVNPSEVFIDKNGKGWYNYTNEQLVAIESILPTLIKKYKTIDLLGHEEISPGRKQDPGPAFWDFLDKMRRKYIKYAT